MTITDVFRPTRGNRLDTALNSAACVADYGMQFMLGAAGVALDPLTDGEWRNAMLKETLSLAGDDKNDPKFVERCESAYNAGQLTAAAAIVGGIGALMYFGRASGGSPFE